MEITEVRVKLMEDSSERLQAFCSITFDDAFVIRDLKIIEGANGPFVAMPSRKLTAHCPGCGSKNHLRAAYCNQCGGRLSADRAARDEDGRTKLYADIAHPINSACREMIQDRVIAEFRSEHERAKLPGYVSRYEDIDVEDVAIQAHSAHANAPPAPHHRPSTSAPPREAQNASREVQNASRGPQSHSRDMPSASRSSGMQDSQQPERLPRAPHRMPPAQATVPARVAPPSTQHPPATGQPPQAMNQPPQGTSLPASAGHPSSVPPRQTGGKPDGFGAGIF